MSPTPPDRIDARIATALGLFAFPVFLAGTSGLVYWRDSVEFAMIPHNLDIGHPAGSPTFAMLGKIIDLSPLGSIAFRSALTTILFACAAAGMAAWLVLRLGRALGVSTNARAAAAAIAVGAFAFSPAWYDWVVAPEVYSAQIFSLLLIGALYLVATADTPIDRRWVFLAGFVVGLSCGVHMGNILLSPGIAFLFFVPHRKELRVRDFLLFGAFAAVGFSVFTYLPVRSATEPPFDQGNPEFVRAFLSHVTGARYAGIVHSFPWPRVLIDLKALAGDFPEQLGPVGLGLALVGLAVAIWRNPLTVIGLLLMLLGHLYLYVKDWKVAFGYLPLFAGAGLFAGIGALWILRRTETWRRSGWALGVVGIAAALLWSGQSVRALRDHSRADHDLTHRHMRAIADSLPSDAVYVSSYDPNSYTFFYQQSVERYRQDITHLQRVFLTLPTVLRKRCPRLSLDGYDPDRPFDAERVLAAAGFSGVFWDYGWEDRDYFDPAHLAPYDQVYRIDPSEDRATDWTEANERRWIRPVADRILRFPADFTARDVYAEMYETLAKYHYDRGRPDQAMARLKQGLAIAPEDGRLVSKEALLLAVSGDLEHAYERAVVATRQAPERTETWNARAQIAAMTHREEDEAASWAASFALNRFQSEVVRYAELLIRARQYAQAEPVADDALAASTRPAERSRARMALAAARVGSGDCRGARPVLDAVLAEQPDHDRAAALRDFCKGR